VNRSVAACRYVCFVFSGFYGLLYDAVGNSGYIASNARIIDEWERTWREATVALSMYYPDISLEGVRETTKDNRIAYDTAEIRTNNINLECCLFKKPFIVIRSLNKREREREVLSV
jgi:hypothetical protein